MSNLEKLIDSVSLEHLIDFCREKSGDFMPQNEIHIPSSNHELFRRGSHKRFASLDVAGFFPNLQLFVFLVKLHPGQELSERSCRRMQFDFACDILKSADWTHSGTLTDWVGVRGGVVGKVWEGLFVFTDGLNFRFSFIQNVNAKTDTVVRRFRRFTFFVEGPNGDLPRESTNRTFREQMAKPWTDSAALQDAFSVQKVSDEFFDAYKAHYEEFVAFCGKKAVRDQFVAFGYADPDKAIRDYVKKLLGRLVFLKFLEKKGWLGVPEGGQWGEGDRRYVWNLFAAKHARHELRDNFLDLVLEPLFFRTLNERRRDDLADAALSPAAGERVRIPYLNGGLFEQDRGPDGTVEHGSDATRIAIPDKMFERLFDTFDRFNFTIDENGPEDAEVGVDPEMLSRIFENLLEDNKDKGAFYTPKEIVEYMCHESLIAYLGDTPANRNLVTTLDVPDDLATEERDALRQKLAAVKVCDPAIGSGAFPMGMLNILYRLRHKLNGGEETSEKIVALKKEIIKNNLYGVDIEAGAVDIARLRFWLSIVVDETEPIPLPNLDYKILQGNSLLESYGGVDLSHVLEGGGTTVKTAKGKKAKRNAWQTEFAYDAETAVKEIVKDKDELFGTTDHRRKTELTDRIVRNVRAYLQHKVDDTHKAEIDTLPIPNDKFCLWHLFFADVFKNGGFDIVIANPPYINVELMSESDKKAYKNLFACFYKRSDIFCLFLEMALTRLASETGTVTFIIPSVVHSNLSYKKLRDLLLDNHWLREVCYTGGDVFKVPTVDTTILVCSKPEVSEIRLKHAVDFAHPRSITVRPDYFSAYQNIISIPEANSGSLFDKLFDRGLSSVADSYDVFQGIVTGNNGAFIFETEADAEAAGIEKALLHPLCHGRDVGRYHIKSRDRRIIYLDGHTDVTKYPKAARWLAQFRADLQKRREVKRGVIPWSSLQWPRVKADLDLKEKILLQRTRNESLKVRIVAALDDSAVYGMEGVYFVIAKSKSASLRFLLGLLNSKLMNYLFLTKFLNLAIKAEYLKQVRLPKASVQQQSQVEGMVDQILAAKKQDPAADTSELEDRIDKLVYKLYGLTDAEIAIVEGRPSASEAKGCAESVEHQDAVPQTIAKKAAEVVEDDDDGSDARD